MATIIKRKSKYSVVYYVVDENGVKRQKWESFDTNAAAKKRKAEIEHQQDTNTFIAPSALTLSDLLDQYLSFACSLRLGELLGLTWDCIDISPESIEAGRAFVYIDKELQRVSREALSQTEEHGVKLKLSLCHRANPPIP